LRNLRRFKEMVKDYEFYPEAGSETMPLSGMPRKMEFNLPKEKEEIILKIRDAESYETLTVKAIVSKEIEDLPGADRLWIKDVTGVSRLWDEKPWGIKIIEVVEEEEAEIVPRANKKISLGRHKNIVQTLIAQKAKEGK
jgi:hypothetical protein